MAEPAGARTPRLNHALDGTKSRGKIPAGPAPLGLLYFVGVKLAGYTVAGRGMNWSYKSPVPKPLTFGVARSGLGLGVGLAFGALALWLGFGHSEPMFYVLLAPVRFAEWLLILWWFYERGHVGIKALAGRALVGSLWSYLLDVPAILSVFVLPGGAWVC